jgi:hypothetical protein
MGGPDAAGFFFDVFNDWPITRYQDEFNAIAIIIRIEGNDRSRADHGICLTSGYWHLDLLLRGVVDLEFHQRSPSLCFAAALIASHTFFGNIFPLILY